MTERLSLASLQSKADLERLIAAEMNNLGARAYPVGTGNNRPLDNCMIRLLNGRARAVIIQRRVSDPDFAAEFSAYYSRQFAHVQRWCTRLHFFCTASLQEESALNYIDRANPATYLGFITLRPVARAPVGATIIAGCLSPGYLRSSDDFPVHLAGKRFSVVGTPFMQQDNAVGACAQASIWMSLRTLRKREGDRAHDPAQITDAATRYFIHGRVRPNRQGLTIDQMTEAVRAAGYSPHRIPLGTINPIDGTTNLAPIQVASARLHLHAYVESEIPVLLALFPPSGGHAVTVIGHTWNPTPAADQVVNYSFNNGIGTVLTIKHAVSYVPEFVVNNDNTGPYQALPQQPVPNGDYSLSSAAFAMPLLPADVFMTGEEALAFGMNVTYQIFDSLAQKMGAQATAAAAANLVIRLQLAEKRKLRKWAASVVMPTELRDCLRLADLPRRVWVFELHMDNAYGTNAAANAGTLVGMVLLDPTGDVLEGSVLVSYYNFPAITGGPQGVLLRFDTPTPTATQVNAHAPIASLR